MKTVILVVLLLLVMTTGAFAQVGTPPSPHVDGSYYYYRPPVGTPPSPHVDVPLPGGYRRPIVASPSLGRDGSKTKVVSREDLTEEDTVMINEIEVDIYEHDREMRNLVKKWRKTTPGSEQEMMIGAKVNARLNQDPRIKEIVKKYLTPTVTQDKVLTAEHVEKRNVSPSSVFKQGDLVETTQDCELFDQNALLSILKSPQDMKEKKDFYYKMGKIHAVIEGTKLMVIGDAGKFLFVQHKFFPNGCVVFKSAVKGVSH